jgi:hypothetical protein
MSTLTIEFAQCRYRLKPGRFIGKPIGPVEYRIWLGYENVRSSRVAGEFELLYLAAMNDAGETNELDRARRHFLRATAYMAPAILATITLNKAHAQASCMPATCMPGACMPTTCMPNTCMPIGG